MFRRLPAAPEYSDEQLGVLADAMRVGATPAAASGWGQAASPAPAPSGPENPAIPSGYTYFGQFVDHDLTFDPASSLGHRNDPDALVDFRTPRFDLDCVYGSGPADEPFQYERDGVRLLLEPNTHGEVDLPRTSQGVAIIGDPRNDENTIVSQMQTVFIRLHNHFAAQTAAEGLEPGAQFAEAQRLTRWHYQWVVLHDFLPRVVGQSTYDAVLRFHDGEPDFRRRFYRPRTAPYMPVEFSGAAYRYGHSQVRPSYDLNDTVRSRPVFLPGDAVGELDDLRGFRPLPSQWTLDWSMFLPIKGSSPQLSMLIDGTLSDPLFDLPGPAGSLALANLRRGQALGLPSGQDVARMIATPTVHSGADLGTALEPTPLWFYLLKESELQAGGLHLGPTGGRIVAEVFAGLLELDPHSFIEVAPTWKPAAVVDGGTFELAELVEMALS